MQKRVSNIIMIYAAFLTAVLMLFCTSINARAKVLNDGAHLYFHFENAANISVNDTYYTISDQNKVYSFPINNPSAVAPPIEASGNVVKTARMLDMLLVLCDNNTLYFYKGATVSETLLDITDFCVDNTTLYTVSSTSVYKRTVSSMAIGAAESISLSGVALISVANEKIFYTSTQSQNSRFIHLLNSAQPLTKTDGVPTQLKATDDYIYYTDSGILRSINTETLLATQHSTGIVSFDVLNDDIIVLDNLYSLKKLGEQVQLIISSQGTTDGFFDRPLGLSAKRGSVYVADSFNNSISVRGADGSFSRIPKAFSRPVDVAADNSGNLYVLHYSKLNECAITAMDSDYNGIDIFYGLDAQTVGIACDADDLFFAAGNKIYFKSGGGFVEYAQLAQKIDQIYCTSVTKGVYALCGDTVYYIKKGVETQTVLQGGAPLSFAVDFSQNLFGLYADGSLIKHSKTGDVESSISVGQSLSQGSKMLISSINGGGIRAGDILYTDAVRNSLNQISAAEAGVSIIEENYPPPVDTSSGEGLVLNSIIRAVSFTTDICSAPLEPFSFDLVEKNESVIVLQYDLVGNDAYSYIMLNRADNQGNAVTGYIYKRALDGAFAYEPPAALSAVAIANTGIYRFPTVFASKIASRPQLNRGESVSLKDFAVFVDSIGHRWYRAEINGGDGYIVASALSLNSFVPTETMPKTNAVIIGSQADIIAYELVDGVYTPISGVTIQKGSRVQVKGGFDPLSKYTAISFYRSDLGVIECYVLTSNLQYEGITYIQIIAFIIALAAVALLILLIIKHRKNQRELNKTIN